jgi:hypothetical protein
MVMKNSQKNDKVRQQNHYYLSCYLQNTMISHSNHPTNKSINIMQAYGIKIKRTEEGAISWTV